MRKTGITREKIVQTLVNALEPLDYVYACWESGAVAFNRVDEWSDIDLNAVVEDNMASETFFAVENSLKAVSTVIHELEFTQLPWPGVSQTFYKLKEVSDYLLIDFAVFEVSSPEKLLEPEIHGNAFFHFNKSDKVKIPILDKEVFRRKLRQRFDRLKTRFELFNVFVQKEINRKNFLEAIDAYHNLTLAMLTEALRIRYYPVHYDFKLRYVHYELPFDITARLSRLYFVKGEEALQDEYREATKWFREIVLEIEKEGLLN